MNANERTRIALAINQLRPDWPLKQLDTLLASPSMCNRPRRDVAVALAWVACESESKTPYRVFEPGPWWRAVVTEAAPTGHHHPAKFHGLNEGDPRNVCGVCALERQDCERRAATNGHDFVARIDSRPRPRPTLTVVPGDDDEPEEPA